MSVAVTTAVPADIAELADVAAQTFPLACPPASPPADIAAFIAANLSAQKFTDYLHDTDRTVLVARADHRIVGYAMLIRGVPPDPDVERAVPERPAIELSKIYVLPHGHGGGASAALMDAAISIAMAEGARCAWLGVNQQNQRAQRFYTKHGFAVSGTKTFTLGQTTENDYVMVRSLR